MNGPNGLAERIVYTLKQKLKEIYSDPEDCNKETGNGIY
jgi:hypothetical protein